MSEHLAFLYSLFFFLISWIVSLDNQWTLLYSLHLVYLNQISITFQDGWNNHASTTEHSMTPLQLFTSGILLNEHGSVPVTVRRSNSTQHKSGETDIPDSTSVPSITQPILTRWYKAFYKYLLNQLIRKNS